MNNEIFERKEILICIGHENTRDELHERLREKLGSERYIGNNLDALHDVLTSISEHTLLIITGLEGAKDALGGYANVLERVFTDSAEQNPRLEVRFE